MPERLTEYVALISYAVAAISGGLGGCGVAAHQVLHGGRLRITYLVAYGIIGCMFGVLALAYGVFLGVGGQSIDSIIGSSIIAGAVGSVVLASTNISARWILKRLGIEVQVTVTRKDKDIEE